MASIMETNRYTLGLDSPIGNISICSSDDYILSLSFTEEKEVPQNPNRLCIEAARQLTDYFTSGRKVFDLPLAPAGTGFQQAVWSKVQGIAFGQKASYLDISKALGDQKAVRAVGMANGKNPIPVIIPCHRVIGNNGTLTGYSGGLWRKKWLLEHESSFIQLKMNLG